MKIQPDFIGAQSISAYGPGWISVAGEKIVRSLVLGSRGERLDWNCQHFDELGAAHFAQLAALSPELVVFGSGKRIRFPQAAWISAGMTQDFEAAIAAGATHVRIGSAILGNRA